MGGYLYIQMIPIAIVYGEKLVPGRNSCINKLLYSAVDARILRWVEIIDVTRELHSPVFLESQVCWKPLILIRPVLRRNSTAAYPIRHVTLGAASFERLSQGFAFACPLLNGIGYTDNFFLEKV